MNLKTRMLAILAVIGVIAATAFGRGRRPHGNGETVVARPSAAPRGPRTIRLTTLFMLAVLAILGAGAFVYFGVYNVAATEQHTPPLYYLLHYTMRRSVSARADRIETPDLSHPDRLRKGFILYRAHCVQCHGGPGVEPNPLGFGTRPEPVNLAEATRDWRPAEVYWVIKHGIKMTGMPAWNYHLSDEELWDLTAFVKALQTISPRDYLAQDKATPVPPPAPMPASNDSRLGDPKAGQYALEQYLCITCHSIPGATGANQNVGPPLDGMARRKYIGGVLANTPENMIRWLRNPQEVDPLSGMPNLHIKEKDIRDIAAYLYTLN